MDTTTEQLANLIRQANQLAQHITDQAQRDQASYNAGFQEAARLFFAHGIDVGRAQAEAETAEAWAHLAATIRNIATNPTHTELTERRNEPGNLYRYATGQDEHPDLYTETHLRRGGPYTGGPVTWNPPTHNTQQTEPAKATPREAA